MEDKRQFFTASDVSISEQESNDIFLTISMRMFSTRANRNNQGVTESFIDEIVANPDKYNCLPLYVDINSLCSGDYQSQRHMFDENTGKFYTTQVGGFCSFSKVNDEYGVSLIGEARIPKRETEICNRVSELYEMGNLNFSFEIKYCPEDTQTIDGVSYVDVSERNALTGMAIVSIPAYSEATALSLVAEVENSEEDAVKETEGVEDKMTLEEALAAIATKDETIAQLQNDVSVAEQAKATAEEALANKEQEQADANAQISEKDATITDLQAQVSEIEELRAEVQGFRSEKAAAELARKQAIAKSFAQKQNLDVNDETVAKAIEELNYEALTELAEKVETPAQNEDVTYASFAGDGMDLKSAYGDLLDPK